MLNEFKLGDKKYLFLSSLASSGQNRYRRYVGSPIRYAGGKSLAVGFVLEQIPSDINYIVSPFIGGGSIEIACVNGLGISVKGYDLFDILTNYWEVQLKYPQELAQRLLQWNPTKTMYKQVKERLTEHWRGINPIKSNIELAAHYWFNHNLSYGPGFLGWMSAIYEDEKRYLRLVERVKSFRASGLNIAQGSFEETIPLHMNDFLYCDPPYYLEGDSKMFRGIYPQRNFPVHHKGFRHDLLRDILHQHKGGFILSYNDCKTIREWYADFEIIEVAWQYTLGQGEIRIGKNRIANGYKDHVKKSHELLILSR